MAYVLEVMPSAQEIKCVKLISMLIVVCAHLLVFVTSNIFQLVSVNKPLWIVSGIQHIPNPDNCQMYYRCVNGVRTSMTCPTGLLFDRIFGDCNLELKVQCEIRNTICEPFRDQTFIMIGNPSDCSRFVKM